MSAPQIISATLPLRLDGTGASAADDLYLGHGQAGEWKLASCVYVPSVTTAANGSAYLSVTLKNGSTAVSSALSSETVACTAGTGRSFSLAEAGTALEFGATDTLFFDIDETGSAAAWEGAFVATWQKVRV